MKNIDRVKELTSKINNGLIDRSSSVYMDNSHYRIEREARNNAIVALDELMGIVSRMEKALGDEAFWREIVENHKAVTWEQGVVIINAVEGYWRDALRGDE